LIEVLSAKAVKLEHYSTGINTVCVWNAM